MRLRVTCLVGLLITGCAPRAGDPAMVEIGAARAPTSAEPATPPRAELTPAQALARLDARLREASQGHASVALEAGGRLVKRDSTDAYEEELYLAEVADVVYVHEPSWTLAHVARVNIKPDGVTRFRRGDEEWTTSTIPHVSFAFRDKRAAEESIVSLRALLKQSWPRPARDTGSGW